MNLQDCAAQAERLIEDVKEENSRLSRELVELRSYSETLHRDFTSLRDAAKQALDERDYYMRECAELRGKFTAFCAMATEALTTHSMAPFRPNGAPPKDEPASENIAKDDGEPIPKFLTVGGGGGHPDAITHPDGRPEWNDKQLQGPHPPAKIEGPLRLKRRIPQ